jgi:hypothetical protein
MRGAVRSGHARLGAALDLRIHIRAASLVAGALRSHRKALPLALGRGSSVTCSSTPSGSLGNPVLADARQYKMNVFCQPLPSTVGPCGVLTTLKGHGRPSGSRATYKGSIPRLPAT